MLLAQLVRLVQFLQGGDRIKSEPQNMYTLAPLQKTKAIPKYIEPLAPLSDRSLFYIL
jgi:hypothetical protein